MLLLSSFSETFFWGGKLPSEKGRMPSRTPILFGRGKSPTRKTGGVGSSPPAHSQFHHALLSSPPKQWQRMPRKYDQSALWRRSLEELRTSRLGLPEEVSIWCTKQGGTSPECRIATLRLRFDGVRHWTTSYLKATLSTASHHIASGPGEQWQ